MRDEAKWGALAEYMPEQRWYGDKGQAIASIEVVDRAEIGPGGAGLAIVRVRFGPGRVAAYLLPLDAEGEWAGALEAPAWAAAMLRATRAEAQVRGQKGVFSFRASRRHGDRLAELAREDFRARPAGAEQSNSSLIYSNGGEDRLVLKCFRRLAPGVNPELEVTEFLSERTSFRALPVLAGSLVYAPDDGGEPWTLAIWQPYIANRGDGWAYAIEALAGEADPGALWAPLAGLGRRTAELHRALGGGDEPTFAPEPIGAGDVAQWLGDLAQWVGRLAPELKRALGGLPAAVAADARTALVRLGALPAALPDLEPLFACVKIRIHGDYHLGQVLRTRDDDWAIFDFEGEPARPLAERRRKHSVLKDVAGMLRSLDYLAFAAGPRVDEDWRAGAREAYWRGYRDALGASELVPGDAAACERALRFFEIEKAVYEIAYELHHRPDWLGIPLAGLRRLLRPGGGESRL